VLSGYNDFIPKEVYAVVFLSPKLFEHALSVPGLGKNNLMTQNGPSWWCFSHLNLSKSLSKFDD